MIRYKSLPTHLSYHSWLNGFFPTSQFWFYALNRGLTSSLAPLSLLESGTSRANPVATDIMLYRSLVQADFFKQKCWFGPPWQSHTMRLPFRSQPFFRVVTSSDIFYRYAGMILYFMYGSGNENSASSSEQSQAVGFLPLPISVLFLQQFRDSCFLFASFFSSCSCPLQQGSPEVG